MKAKRHRKKEKDVAPINVAMPAPPPRKPQEWRDCCGISKEQWEYSAKWSDYLDWAIALEAARQEIQQPDAAHQGQS